MPVSEKKEVDAREWPLDPVDGEDVVARVTHVATTKDLGLPSQTVEHRWEMEIQRGRVKLVTVVGAGQAEMDNALNVLRLAVVDMRAVLPDMEF